MEKKKYTKPSIVKVELKHEQAVLGVCAADAGGDVQDSDPAGVCRGVVMGHPYCKAIGNKTGDSDAIS